MHASEYRPECFTEPDPANAFLGEYGWLKSSLLDRLPGCPISGPCDLPDGVFDRLEGGVLEDGGEVRWYAGRIAATKALEAALNTPKE